MSAGIWGPRSRRWAPYFLITLIAALAAIVAGTTSSASAASTVETPVWASDHAVAVLIEPRQRETAGQQQAREVLAEMGIHVPSRLASHGEMTTFLRERAQMTPAQVEKFLEGL